MSWLESQGFEGLKRPGAVASIRRRALAVICVLAVAFQSIVLESHFHRIWAGSNGSEVAATLGDVPMGANDPARKSRPPAGDPPGCFICHQLALAGAAVLPEAFAPVPFEHSASTTFVSVDLAIARTVSSHNWRSRAPPFLL